MRVRLKVLKGSKSGKLLPIQGKRMLIGRDEGCDLRPRTDVISRRHCVINVTDSQVLIKDLGSTNGTWVNGQRIETERGLQSQDMVKVGPLEFEVLIEKGPAKRPEVKNVAEVVQRTAEESARDFDVSSWLEEVDQEERDERLRDPETRQFIIDETNGVIVQEDTVDASSDTSVNETPKAGGKKIKKKNKFGKLPQAAKESQKHNSSCEAAQDMLKKLFTKG